MARQQGFTLVEIALVMVVIGLILGGLLKGQALIDNARTRSMADQIDNVSAAWYGFFDRYRAIPGDFDQAGTRIDDGLANGGGDGRIDNAGDVARVWQHLSAAGFIAGDFDGETDNAGALNDNDCRISTCPTNPFGGYMKISHNADTGALELSTGANVPARVLMQLDLKLDDGDADSGRFQMHPASDAGCAAGAVWSLDEASANCAGVWLNL